MRNVERTFMIQIKTRTSQNFVSPFQLNYSSRDNADDEDDEEEDDDDDYISDDELNKSQFQYNNIKTNPNPISFGPGRGRSAPSQRKAMGKSGSGDAVVHVCTNCGAEYVKWMGRCPTCKEWNTIQEFKVERERSGGGNSAKNRPVFGSGFTNRSNSNRLGVDNFNRDDGTSRPSSWLTGVDDDSSAHAVGMAVSCS